MIYKRITTETKRKKDEEIVHTLAVLFFALTDDILVVSLFTSTREFESIIIIVLVFFVYVAIKVRHKTEILEGDLLEI